MPQAAGVNNPVIQDDGANPDIFAVGEKHVVV